MDRENVMARIEQRQRPRRQQRLKDFEVLHLREEAREVFVQAVLNPPAPNDAARAAAERYKKQIGALVGRGTKRTSIRNADNILD
jgi:hypothetical protein